MLYDTTTYYKIQAYSRNTCPAGAVLVTSSILASSQLSPNQNRRVPVDGSRADFRAFGAFSGSVVVRGGSAAAVRFCALCGPLAAIQSQAGRTPFLADGFCPFAHLQRFTASAHTRPAEASAGPLADTARPICPGLGRRAGLPARRPRLAALKRWCAGGFLSPAQGAAADHPRSPVVLRGLVGRLARLRALQSAL